MDTEAAFENIKNDIKDEKYDMVLPQVKQIVEQSGGDVQILFKCAVRLLFAGANRVRPDCHSKLPQ